MKVITEFSAEHPNVTRYTGVVILFVADRILKVTANYFDVEFPSALIGMFLIIASLVGFHKYNPAIAANIMTLFDPAVEFVAHKWLALFYSPALSTLPLALLPLTGISLVKSTVIVLLGVCMTAGFTGHMALAVRRCSGILSEHATFDEKPLVFTRYNWGIWGVLAGVSALLTLDPSNEKLFQMGSFCLQLSAALVGYMGGMILPANVKRFLHPVILCAIAPNVAALWLGRISGTGYWAVIQVYVTKGAGGVYGPGDVLFAFLGTIILCFGFKVFTQWEVLMRHKTEVLASTIAAAAFTMISTALMARIAGLPSDLARSLVPRGATLALALPMAELLHASQQLTAAAVALTGILGANFLGLLLNGYRLKDPISRGLSAAATAHGMGAAVLGAQEPEALPFCALSYAFCGVFATLLIAFPPFRELILAITG